jgi:hypothetical protein
MKMKILVICSSLLFILSTFYWFQYRPMKISQDCSWVKKHQDAVPTQPAMTEEELEAKNMLEEECQSNIIEREEKPVEKTMEMEEDVPILKSEDEPEAEILGVTDEQKATPTTDVKKTADDLKIILPSPTSSVFINPTVNNPQSPTPVINQQPKTYSIIPISTMSIRSMEPNLQTIAHSAYQEFLGTANLNQLDQSTQVQILIDIYSRMLKEDIAETQQNIIQLREDNQPTVVPEVLYVNLEIEAKLDELRQTLNAIRNQAGLTMSVIEGRKQRAYQDWMLNNSEIHPLIIGSRYANDLNSILIIYGL